jgi:hypothetical protein
MVKWIYCSIVLLTINPFTMKQYIVEIFHSKHLTLKK